MTWPEEHSDWLFLILPTQGDPGTHGEPGKPGKDGIPVSWSFRKPVVL